MCKPSSSNLLAHSAVCGQLHIHLSILRWAAPGQSYGKKSHGKKFHGKKSHLQAAWRKQQPHRTLSWLRTH